MLSEKKQELQVAALENGTVIDHIPSERLFTVVSPARTGTHEQQYHYRLQPQEQEAGHERYHQDCRQVLLRRRDKPYRRGGSQCKN